MRRAPWDRSVFLFDTTRIELDTGSVETVVDPSDLLHREPLVAHFRVRGPPARQAFTFSLVNIHTDPDETDGELDALGDFNVDEHYIGELGRLPNITWVISGLKTNTRGTKSYDNIIFNRSATPEYTGHSGVLDLQSEFDLSLNETIKVSDHLSVWATFSIYEGGRIPLAGNERPTVPR